MFLKNSKDSFNIKREVYFDYDLEINTDYNFDMTSLYSEEVISKGLVAHFDVNNPNSWDGKTFKSVVKWDKSVLSGFTINDIGLNGVDTGIVSNFSGETLMFTTGSTMELRSVKASEYYSGVTSNRITTTKHDFSGLYLNQSNNIYQGFYKLDSYPYQLLPLRNERGFTYQFWISLDDVGNTGTTLNNLYPNNKNIFFYQGIRGENKFTNNTGLTKYNTTTGVPLYDINDKKIAEGKEFSSITGQTYSAVSFQIKDNKIGYKSLIPLLNENEDLVHRVFSGYSQYEIFSGDTRSKWVNITVKFERNTSVDVDYTLENCEEPYDNVPCEDNIPNNRKGVLTFFINARPVFKVKDFIEPIFNKLLTDKSKQQSVPYNISFGGGAVGLKYNQIINVDGEIVRDDLVSTLIEENFAGTFDGSLSQMKIYDRPLNITEIINNFKSEQKRYRRIENFGGSKIFMNKPFI